jgi:uncharacterized protein
VVVYFFDSSAIVKRYLIETGTAWVGSITDLAAGNKVYLARVTLVEVISAIALRAYDAVQLAAAQEINANMKSAGAPPITLVSADVALNAAALAEGLAVDDPNTHP